jgi:putative acyl-CoA dehydrogenase
VFADLERDVSGDPRLVDGLARARSLMRDPRLLEIRARSLVETLARVAAGTLLRRHAPAPVADPYIETRLGAGFRRTYGQGLERADTRAILDRALAPTA